jgi:hypothetical protein
MPPFSETDMDIFSSHSKSHCLDNWELVKELTVECIQELFEPHKRFAEPNQIYRTGTVLPPKPLSRKDILNQCLLEILKALSFVAENGSNFEKLLIEDVKNEEKSWKCLQQDLIIDLQKEDTKVLIPDWAVPKCNDQIIMMVHEELNELSMQESIDKDQGTFRC